jgi:S-adenosylmethionine:tRNA ribosyltransferase-isomerase
LNLSDFNYHLPSRLIAQEPLPNRSGSRLLLVERKSGKLLDKSFLFLLEHLNPGDCLVLNESKVIPARLFGRKKTGAVVEMLLVEPVGESDWLVLARPAKRLSVGDVVVIVKGQLEAEIKVVKKDGLRVISFNLADGTNFWELLNRIGKTPLPPYIHNHKLIDRQRYQTVFAAIPGSVAAPTAGLHFTKQLLKKIADQGVLIASLVLHVGPGTFQPLREEVVERNSLHSERFLLSQEAANKINLSKSRGGKIIAVGTTTVRVLETCADGAGRVKPKSGKTNLFIYPGYQFKMVDELVTNFHLPKSSLLLLVSAFTGVDLTKAAYRHAIKNNYRFFSFGDAMLIF